MQFRDFAIQILSATTLEEKLFTPENLTDETPGKILLWEEPSRPSHMGFSKHGKKDKLPPFHEHNSAEKRAACLHRFAGHELLAVEIMAFAILAFPNAPKSFRKGLMHTLKEEQGHVKLYLTEMKRLGINFGDLPLYRHFWTYTPFLTTPEQYVSLMSLTFEMANLDFAPHYGASFLRHGDEESALLMNRILQDEIRHVSFGLSWLKKLKNPNLTEWQAWVENLPPRVTPDRATGFIFNEKPRIDAGVSDEWIHLLKKAYSKT